MDVRFEISIDFIFVGMLAALLVYARSAPRGRTHERSMLKKQ